MKILVKPEALVARGYPWTEESWIASAVSNPDKIDAAIHSLGLQDKRVTDDVRQLVLRIALESPRGFEPDQHSEPDEYTRWRIADTIRDWFKGIKVVEVDSTIVTQEIPLFVLNSPALPNAKTIFCESESHGNNLSWKIEILGTGFGGDLTVTATHEGEFASTAGARNRPRQKIAKHQE